MGRTGRDPLADPRLAKIRKTGWSLPLRATLSLSTHVMSTKAKLPVLVLILLITLGIGAIGAWVTAPAIPSWYAALNKPSFNPPNWLFAPVWSALYCLMSVAIWLAWRRAPGSQASLLLTVYGIQLAANLLWSILFFAGHLPSLALADCLLLTILIAWMIRLSGKASRLAGWLLVPYLLWVSFAALLNAAIIALN